jgi:hypothetical protein
MLDSKVGIPLTFLLALAAAGPATEVVKSGQTAEWLTPGSLQRLLDQDKLPAAEGTGDTRGNPETTGRMAQGCFYGYWRRC